MHLSEILSPDRILVDAAGESVRGKNEALRILADLLSEALGVESSQIERLLTAREQLQSTGIGEGVAIPHTSIADAERQAGALVLCPSGVPFDAIDAAPVTIIFGVVGPKRATGEHLKTLARISRLLRDEATRGKLIASANAEQAYELIHSQDSNLA